MRKDLYTPYPSNFNQLLSVTRTESGHILTHPNPRPEAGERARTAAGERSGPAPGVRGGRMLEDGARRA